MPASHCPDFHVDGNTIMEIFKIGTDRIQIGLFAVSSLTIVEPFLQRQQRAGAGGDHPGRARRTAALQLRGVSVLCNCEV